MADLISSLPAEYKSKYPALQPPPGVQSNFVDPDSRGYVLLTVGSILFALMVLFLAARIYVRFFVARQFSWGDVTCIFAALGATAYFINQIIAVKYSSLGKHLWDVPIIELGDRFFITIAFLSVVLVNPTLLAAKLTLFQLYNEIFHPFRWMRICVYIGIAFTTAFYVATSIVQIVLTAPRKGETWLSHAFSDEEYASQKNAIPFASVGLVIDVYLLILPIKAIMDLQLAWKRKLAVGLVFLTGLLACLASSLSIWYRVGYNHTSDTTWASVNVILTALVEMNVGVIVACMPSVPKLFLQQMPRLKAFQLSFRKSYFRSGSNSGVVTEKYASTEPSTLGLHSESQASQTIHKTDPDQSNIPLTKGYFKISTGAEPYDRNHKGTVSTHIQTGNAPPADVSHHQIHLKHDVWQSV